MGNIALFIPSVLIATMNYPLQDELPELYTNELLHDSEFYQDCCNLKLQFITWYHSKSCIYYFYILIDTSTKILDSREQVLFATAEDQSSLLYPRKYAS